MNSVGVSLSEPLNSKFPDFRCWNGNSFSKLRNRARADSGNSWTWYDCIDCGDQNASSVWKRVSEVVMMISRDTLTDDIISVEAAPVPGRMYLLSLASSANSKAATNGSAGARGSFTSKPKTQKFKRFHSIGRGWLKDEIGGSIDDGWWMMEMKASFRWTHSRQNVKRNIHGTWKGKTGVYVRRRT